MTDSSPDPLASLCSPSPKRVRSPTACSSSKKPIVNPIVSPYLTPRIGLSYLEVGSKNMDDICTFVDTISPPPSRMATDDINQDSDSVIKIEPGVGGHQDSKKPKRQRRSLEKTDKTYRPSSSSSRISSAESTLLKDREMRKPPQKRRKRTADIKHDQNDNISEISEKTNLQRKSRQSKKSQTPKPRAKHPVESRQSSVASVQVESPGRLRPSIPNIESSDLAFPPPELIKISSSTVEAANHAAQVLMQHQYERVDQWNTHHWRVLESLLDEVGPEAAVEKFIETQGFDQGEVEKRVKVLEIKRGLKNSDRRNHISRARSVETDTMSIADNAEPVDETSTKAVTRVEDSKTPENKSQSPGLWTRLFGSKDKNSQKKQGWFW